MSNIQNHVETYPEMFKAVVIDLIDLFKNIVSGAEQRNIKVPVSSAMISFLPMLLKNEDPNKMIELFIKRSHEFWYVLAKKDGKIVRSVESEKVVKSNLGVFFTGLDSSHVESVNSIYELADSKGKPAISENDRDTIWEYLYSFASLAVKHIHKMREPVKVNDKIIYTKTYMKDIKVKEMAKLLEIDLSKVC